MYLLMFIAVQPSIGTGDSDGQLCDSFYFVVLGCERSQHSKFCCTSAAPPALAIVDQELTEATGEHIAALITDAGHQSLALDLLCTLMLINTSSFLPVLFNFDTTV